MSETKILDVRYVGRSKARSAGLSALGWSNGEWRVVLPETVLRKWFRDEDPTIEKTLYGVLGVDVGVQPADLKSAYRRLALQWHPDQCKEPNATEVFRRIQESYDILSNAHKRARYDAGLAFEKSLGNQRQVVTQTDGYGYRTPLRSGLILCEGNQQGKWFVVSTILQWADIVQNGKTLIANWVYGEDKPQERWV